MDDDDSLLLDAVDDCSLDLSPDSIVGIRELGCVLLFDVEMLGLELRLLGELGDGILLAVEGLDWDLLFDELEDSDSDCDFDLDWEELDALDGDFCCCCAGGCCCVC